MSTIVITGSTQGIGRGLATEFCRRGHNVVIAGRNPERVEETLSALSGESGQAAGQACEVADQAQVQRLWDLAAETFGSVDIWINNAGLARTVWPILEVPQEEIETMVRTNMLGTINGSRVAAAGMFTDALVKELADTPVIVGKIRPGMIITEAVIREAKADMENFQKSRRMMNNLVDQPGGHSGYRGPIPGRSHTRHREKRHQDPLAQRRQDRRSHAERHDQKAAGPVRALRTVISTNSTDTA
jgi:NAD(P)-dependent dehydrogenase (short-subunit alcohol dehydrogenase family)